VTEKLPARQNGENEKIGKTNHGYRSDYVNGACINSAKWPVEKACGKTCGDCGKVCVFHS
jgi:hypothetical protein